MDRPTTMIQTHLNSSALKTGFLCPVAQVHCVALISDQACSGTVLDLLRHGGPTDIARLIVSFIVNAIKSMLRSWCSPDIFKECFKRIEPAIANCYSATTIAIVTLHAWIANAPKHCIPGAPFLGSLSTTGLAMAIHRMIFAFRVCLGASAAFRFALPEGISSDLSDSATIAMAEIPFASMFAIKWFFSLFQNCPFAKGLVYHSTCNYNIGTGGCQLWLQAIRY